VLVSPCTLCPPLFRPSLAGCAAGVKFPLLHLPPVLPGRSETTDTLRVGMWDANSSRVHHIPALRCFS
jgi:hypothetical protein